MARAVCPAQALAAAPATTAPLAAASAVSEAAAPLLANFNGTSSRDSAVTNFNLEFEPPDQGLCVGNGFVADMVNSAYTIYKPNGAVVSGPFNVNGPFDEGLTEFTSDPRCYYDSTTNTWFATILFISGGDFGSVVRRDVAPRHRGQQPQRPNCQRQSGRSHEPVDRLSDRHH